ncbi:hypothetical protein [Natronococcus occultus]|uniref:Uncharacterized protein n=1 Tax=Natronococcus occultus SP4 TaxID=694430 RepID=L0JXC6_9EURY|nr:hypothetical protein [Natronococcus occultus]AGB36759.1 hypothetical protein Natoc_0910 [Natronococcus occultus SP4]
MSAPGAGEDPPYLGNFLYLVAAVLLTGLATTTIVGRSGLEGVLAYAVAVPAFVAVFVGLLAIYNRYYLAD